VSTIKDNRNAKHSHLAAAAFIVAEEDTAGVPGGSPFDPGKPGGIPAEGGRTEEPGGKPPLRSPGPFPCGEACIVKEGGGTSPLAVSLSHKSKGLPHTIMLVTELNLQISRPIWFRSTKKIKAHSHTKMSIN